MALNELLRKVEFIKEQTTDIDKMFEEDEETADDFTKLKKTIDRSIKAIRQQLEERRGLTQGADKAIKSSEIRKQIRGAKKLAEELDEMQAKASKKMAKKKDKPKYEEPKKQCHIREQVVKLVWAHIREIEQLEKKDFIGANDDYFEADEADRPPCTVTSLPRIDTPEGYLMQQNEAKIDALLDVLGAAILETKNIASAMGQEADRQGVHLDDLNNRTGAINEKLETYNEHLYELVKQIKGADKFCLNITIFLLVLGLVGVFVSFFLKK